MAAAAGPIAGQAISGLFGMAGGKAQADAAKYAALLQSQGADKALAFAKDAAENDWRNFETTRKANYGQWQAREGRLSTLGHLIGMPDREVPPYVPSVDPDFAGHTAAALQRAQGGRARDLV